MHLQSLLLAFMVLATSLAAARPSTNNNATCETYKLRTAVISGDPTKNGLYVIAYHIYAGGNDVVLADDTYSVGFQNGTHQQFDLNTPFPWGFTLAHSQAYTQWLTVEIDVGYGDANFYMGDKGLVSSNPSWKGWIACDWWHGVPQLFWQYNYAQVKLPSSCATVNLIPEYL